MKKRKTPIILIGHIAALLLTLGLAWLSGQNPRALLYAHGISLFLLVILCWLFAVSVEQQSMKNAFVRRFSRNPTYNDKSSPYRNEKTREPVGIGAYLMMVLTLFFMLGVLQFMAHGKAFLQPSMIFPEMAWGLLLGLVYVVNDLVLQRIVIDVKADVPKNLGYNVSGLSILFAAIFISAFLYVVSLIIVSVAGIEKSASLNLYIEWIVFVVLGVVRMSCEVAKDLKKQKGSFKKLSNVNRNQ